MIYVLNLKLKDMQVTIEVYENDDIAEVVKNASKNYNLSKDIAEAL